MTQNYDLWPKWTERSGFFTVTFDTNGGSYVFPKRVQKGTFCLPPNPSPTKDGFIFIDWCVDKGLSQPWKFSIEPVVEDITVYAKWEDASMVKKAKVVFDLNGGDSAPIPEQEVPDRGRVAKPENPTKTGFDFVGWESVYKGLGMPFDIDTTLVYYDAYPDHILTLRARWQEAGTKEQVKVTFEFDGGTLPDGTVSRKTVTVDKGHPVANPGEPSYASRLFMYWYLDDMNAGPDRMYDFTLPVYDKCTLRARTRSKNHQMWTVTFMVGDTEWKSVQVEDGELCAKPTPDPVRASYTFEYWCSDRE